MKNNSILIAGFGIVAGLIGLVAAGAVAKNAKDAADMISSNVNVDIDMSNPILHKAVDKAVANAAKSAAESVKSGMAAKITEKVGEAVNMSQTSIDSKVANVIGQQIDNLDMNIVQDKAIEAVKAKALETVVKETKKIFNFMPNNTNNTDITGIIRECKAAGMSQWRIQEIVNEIMKH